MTGFDELLAANERYAQDFALQGFDGIARAGVCVVTCMDSRLEPLEMIGLRVGDAKILRTPGGHVDDGTLRGCILATQLLGATRILVVEHTRCAMGGTDASIKERIALNGGDASGYTFGATVDQEGRVRFDVARLRAEPLISSRAEVGGFCYDVDSGRLTRIC